MIDLSEREIVVGPDSWKNVNDIFYKKSRNKVDDMQPLTKNVFYDEDLKLHFLFLL